MAFKMLGRTHSLRHRSACGCCGDAPSMKKRRLRQLKRRQLKRRERQAWKREAAL